MQAGAAMQPSGSFRQKAVTADPDLSEHLHHLAASFASQYSPLEFIVKALVMRLSTVESTVGIGLDEDGPTFAERMEMLEKKVSNLAHNIQVPPPCTPARVRAPLTQPMRFLAGL